MPAAARDAAHLPERPWRTLAEARSAAAGCRACDLWQNATRTVFGDGSRHAEVMLVGEQPGDHEDLAGQPFVGPAGRVLAQALARAGIDPARTYVTNAVKHFKFRREGKRRIHERPRVSEVRACRPWLEHEARLVAPRAIVCLGATAAHAVLGRRVTVNELRGRARASPLAPLLFVTIHPSAVLRAPDAPRRKAALDGLVADLGLVARALRGAASG